MKRDTENNSLGWFILIIAIAAVFLRIYIAKVIVEEQKRKEKIEMQKRLQESSLELKRIFDAY